MRKTKFAPNENYHIYNRGNDKRPIFLDNSDYIRFLFLIIFFQSPSVPFYNISHHVAHYVKHRVFNIDLQIRIRIVKERAVELISFTLMPNHFHILLLEKDKGGISRYMQRILDAYTKYWNTKHQKSGHLFQGPFGAKYIETNEQLLYTSAYIHRNQHELSKWHGKEALFPWSSYYDYVEKNRWGKLLSTERLLEQFPTTTAYREFVDTSTAKDNTGEETISL